MPLLPQLRNHLLLVGLFCLLLLRLSISSCQAESKEALPSILPPTANAASSQPDLPSTKKLDSVASTPASEGGPSVAPLSKVHFGAADEKDPFGVDYNGPFNKNPQLADTTEQRKFTLKMIVDSLIIQAIMIDTSETLINSNLFKQGDQFNVKWVNEMFTVTIKTIEADKIHFTWNKDDKEVIYVAPAQADYLSPVDGDPMKALQQPPLPVINFNPTIPTTTATPTKPNKYTPKKR